MRVRDAGPFRVQGFRRRGQTAALLDWRPRRTGDLPPQGVGLYRRLTKLKGAELLFVSLWHGSAWNVEQLIHEHMHGEPVP